MSELDNLFDQVPDEQVKKSSLDTAFDLAPDNKPKVAAVPATPVDSSVIPAEPKKFPDVMPGGQVLGVQKQDVITPPIDLAPASKWKFNLDYSQSKDNVANTTSETIAATGGAFDRSLSAMFNQLDFVQTSLGDALNQIVLGKKTAVGIQEIRNKYGVHLDDIGGQPNINSIRPFKAISEAINFAAGNTQLPETVGGQVLSGVAQIGPQILATYLAPEISAGKVLGKLGIDYFSKFGLVMGAQGLVQSAKDNQTSSDVQKLTTPIIKGIEQFATGTAYDMFGGMASKVGGRLAEKLIPEFSDVAKVGEKYAHGDIKLTPDQAVNKMLVNSLGTTAFNAAVIGGYGNLVEFMENGDTSWKTFATGAGMGLAMGGKEVGKLMMAKGFNSLVSADPGMIERSINSPVGSEELISMAQAKFKSISDGTSKNPEGDAAAGLLATRAAVLKGILEEVQTNPTDILKTIEESTMPPEAKKTIIESLNQIVANTDRAVVESKPINDKIKAIDDQIEMIKNNSNLASTDQEIKTQSLAAKREGLVNKVIDIHAKYAKIKTPAEERVAEAKRIEDTKQANIIQSKAAVVFPKFNEDGTKLAEDLGGRFESRLKAPESMVGKTTRTGNEVSTTEDVIGGAIILPDMKSFKTVSKKLKNDGYTISNKRLPNKETGWQGVTATKMVDGIGTEIQLHTEDTWKAHQEALKLTNPYREGIPSGAESMGIIALGSRVPVSKAEKRILGIKSEDAFTMPIAKDGESIGTATIENLPEGWRVKWIDTNGARMKDSNTRGTGREAMQILNQEAQKEGKVLISDIPGKTSDQAQKAWNNLVDSGDAEKVGSGWRMRTKEAKQIVERPVKPGSVNLNSTDISEKDKFTEPYTTYSKAEVASDGSKSKNLWIKPDGGEDNSGRVLMGQFTSRLMGTEAENANKSADYYASVYNNIPGYARAKDFWEIPQWQAQLANSFNNVDSYVIRDVKEAKKFIENSGYKEVAFSVLDVTKDKVKALAEALPDVKFNVGGYIDMSGYFKDNPNVKTFGSIEEMAKDHGVDYKPGYDYRHFEGAPVIPRLQMSTGCLHICAFCTVSKDNPFKSIDIKTIDEHVNQLKKLKAPLVYLDDKTFGQAESYKHLPEIYKKLKEANPNFKGFIIQTTASAVKSTLPPEFIKDAGIKFIELGVESYNDPILKAIHKPASTKIIDDAVNIIRQTDAKLIPNIIIGMPEETRQSYDNTLKFLEGNKDIISHANIYSLALYKGTELGNSIEAKMESDRNENVVEKSFHTNPELHKEALDQFLEKAKEIVEVNTPEGKYKQAMDQSKALYDQAYKPLETINLEGSPAKTVAQRKMKELGIPMDQQKELNKSWTEMKNKVLGELKDKNIETKTAFADFIKSMPNISDLGIKLQKRMLAKVNSIDFTKPTSLNKAIDYFDKIVNRATWRYDEVKSEQALDILVKKGNPESLIKKALNQPSKNIKGVHGLPLWDELTILNDNMHNKSWADGQQKIKDIENTYTSENRLPTIEEMNQITDYNFWGALNSTNEGGVGYLIGAARDLISIRKQGYSDAAARKMIMVGQNAETMRARLDALYGKSLTPEELAKLLDTRFNENKQKTLFDKLNNATNWPITSSFGSRIEFLAQKDKTSAPYQGILYESLVKPLEAADLGNFVDTKEWRNEVNDKASEIFGTKPGRQTWKNAADRTKTIYEVKFKNVAGKDDMLPITMNQAITVYMQLQDPTLEKSHEAGYYKRNGELTSLGQGVLDVLTPKAKAWGDYLINEFYPKMYERLNPVYRMLYGRDMPFNSLYSPIFIQGTDGRGPVSEDLLGHQGFVAGLKNGSLLDRVRHAKVLNLADSDRVMESYLHNMAYWKNYTEGIQNLNDFVKDPAIRNTIKQNFPNGEDHLRYLEQKVQIYLRKPSDAWMIANTFSTVRNNILVSSLALKALVGVNQISAAPAFAEYIPMKEIPKYGIESLYNWLGDKGNVALAKKIWNDPYMQQRYKEGWDNVLTSIVGADIHSVGNKVDWKSKLMFPTKYGDFASVLIGGIPVYRYHYDQAMQKYGNENMAHIAAMQVVREATGSTQQSGLEVDLAPIQEANAVFKAITMYKSAPFQYQRKVAAAVRNLISGRGSISQNIKTIAIYHVLLPSLFQFMSNGFKWDTEEEVRSAVLGPYNDLLAYGDIAEGLWNIYNGESWKKYRASPVLSIYDDAEALVQHGMKVHPSIGRMTKGLPDEYIPEVMKAAEGHRWNMLETGKALKYASKIIGEVSGLPVPGVTSIGQGVYDVATGKEAGKSVGYKMQRILGRSDYTLQDAVDESNMTLDVFDKAKAKEVQPIKKQPVKSKSIPNF